jgi:hypothetical protein
MKWIQSEYDKTHGLERYFLRPDDWEDTQDPATWVYEAEWHASVINCEYDHAQHGDEIYSLPRGMDGHFSGWLATIEPADDELDYWFGEYFPTREEAERWAELEIQPERLKVRLVEWKLDRGAVNP